MGIVDILADGMGLMLGSLLAAALLTFSAWWLADRVRRPQVALFALGVIVVGLLVSPLEHSLFVRMVAVFAMVGMGLLWFVGPDGAALPGNGEREGIAFSAARDRHRR